MPSRYFCPWMSSNATDGLPGEGGHSDSGRCGWRWCLEQLAPNVSDEGDGAGRGQRVRDALQLLVAMPAAAARSQLGTVQLAGACCNARSRFLSRICLPACCISCCCRLPGVSSLL